MSQATNDNSTSPTHLRGRMEKAVEQLLAALDALEAANEDLEDTDTDGPGEDEEPSLGFIEPELNVEHYGYFRDMVRTSLRNVDQSKPQGNTLDLEDEHDGREEDDPGEDGGDHEPSLGSFNRMIDQTKSWKARDWNGSDCELDESEREPSLGAPEVGPLLQNVCQVRWAASGNNDREFDPAEHGEAEQGI